MSLLKPIIQMKFTLTSRSRASAQIRKVADKYYTMAEQIESIGGSQSVRVPKMIGVDEDMRDWSFYMLLQHNVIVNRVMTITTMSLAKGKIPDKLKEYDIKKDVMPGENPGIEQVSAFRKSVDHHLRVVSEIQTLRGTPTYPHPIFGKFDAHKWHCMLGFHLLIHIKQARYILENSSLVQS